MSAVGRNEPCPCYSGKKYKHCCMTRSSTPLAAGEATSPVDALNVAWSFFESGQATEAANLCRTVLRSDATQPDALYLLGVLACESGNCWDALELFRKAALARPQFPEAHYYLGLIHMRQAQHEQAASHYRQAIASAPGFVEAHCNLGVVLNRLGQPLQALSSYQEALAISEATEVKIGLAECLQRLRVSPGVSHLRPLLTRAIAEAWRRPEELAPAAIAFLKCEAGFQEALSKGVGRERLLADWCENRLLLALLESATICDVELERLLTAVRETLLDDALRFDVQDDELLSLRSALAQQCFVNEYSWLVHPEESEKVEELLKHASLDIESGRMPLPQVMLALASYLPLCNLPFVDALREHAWSGSLRSVIRQQIDEVRQELNWRSVLPKITAIDQDSSSKVQQQYEENPYPHWVRSSLFPAPLALDDRLRMQIPHARFQPMRRIDTVDVLIAGCGSGRHSTESASAYSDSRVLAIDLSASSLAYAMRKSHELGQCNVEYAQADILQLSSLNRRFDLIESVGVLHHLADPAAGWRALLQVLRPGGLMLLGLYSEAARAPVVAARQFIAHRGYPATAQGIRECRAAIMGADCPEALSHLTAFGDFYGLSACRDLLFHAQEHRTNLLAIDALLNELSLDLVGLHVEPEVLRKFQARFPDDDSVHDLGMWHQFETENPQTFVGMYQFWVQKRCA
ncbi:methyltransferase domain-containing protein [Hydrogenophaga sp. BPS33]|uniref:methyltransferase domain-containing protein n=1 Tax=Hydrogenophaga sp. BPS33 TaxID=2651974 RepID=UPI00131FE490|nr:methyltransferase domain-containing protein [Hydrogenophaga sp. BPS33]QHE89199.1 methyltransferase domain-containing protein [Hydrogenophaga sp. BPS33]